MGPPTISADQPAHAWAAASAISRASMGPPTISADQLKKSRLITPDGKRFNGAADDLGGSTSKASESNWTALKFCFNGAADDLGGSTRARHGLRILRRCRFNGAADDLGGSTPPTPLLSTAPSACFNGAADDLGGSTPPQGCHVISTVHRPLQWGRRRSRRINVPHGAHLLSPYTASMGPPTISADQRYLRLAYVSRVGASMGPPTISADQRGRRRTSSSGNCASMGPPTISADQRHK